MDRHAAPVNILVFLHGTSIMHAAAEHVRREDRVRQVREGEASVRDYRSYLPTPGASEKLTQWSRRGATIAYFSSHNRDEDIGADQAVLRRHGFPDGPVHARASGESYGEAVERLRPDVVVEDDCESIGGATETIASQLSEAAARNIRCIVLPEFAGFGSLPDDPAEL
jgi:hypothetical protein